MTRELELHPIDQAELGRWPCRCGCGGTATHGLYLAAAPDAPAVNVGCAWSMRMARHSGLDALGRLERTAHDRLVGQPETWAAEHAGDGLHGPWVA